ncbi:hypothetical protein ABZ070_36255 [Streptomyces sp. NPDC006283]|uniref:hypothetical protein n=1 Tax=Streptomyces sp. NPDC006283 TaxID=3156741 RepID=UPI0033A2ADE0
MAAIAATFAAAGLVSGTAQAAQSSQSAASCGSGWSFAPEWGASAGHPCWNPAHVNGWVADRKKDGRCVFMRFDWYRNGHMVDSKDTPVVCDHEPRQVFNLKSADPYATWVSWRLQYV